MSGAPDLRTLPDELRLDSQNPWPGLTAFTEKQHDFFFGRSLESHELFACVKRERLTVLFGKSGLGKTSLLQAGLFPQLRDADYLPVYVRLSYEDGAASFNTQIKSALESAIESANFAEVALPQPGESVWEYLHRRGGNLVNDAGNVVMPVLVFDQFEECFTLAARKDFAPRLIHEFLPGLGDMIENRIPTSLTKKLTEDRDLAKRYDLEAPGCRILITLREDYLANLEALRDSMPSLVYIDNRMRLTEMTGEQALSVVVDPSPDLVDPDVAESIVRFVAGAHTDSADGDVRTVDALPLKNLEVAPAILSLFCSQLNEERLKTPGMAKITRALVLSQGVTIIEDFYKKCIAGMHPAVRRLIEDRLLTTAGYRDNIDLAEARATLERAGADASYIDDLVKLRLLQIEDHRGVPRLELTHDVLAEPVKHSRDNWKKEQQHEAAQQQEREDLLRAKEAEKEALKRTRFLQKMVAAGALVCLGSLALAGAATYAYLEQKQARSNAARAQQLEQVAQARASQAQQEAEIAKDDEVKAKLAEESAEKAKLGVKAAELSTLLARANEKKAMDMTAESNSKALAMQNNLVYVSGRALNFCVTIRQSFETTAASESNDAGKDAVLKLYQRLLMDPDQCLALAKEAYKDDPNNIDVSDSIAMISVQAAASAADLHISTQAKVEQLKEYFSTALALPMFHKQTKDDGTQLELASVYFAFAFLFDFVHNDAAQATADEGMNILNTVRPDAQSNTWDYQVWDVYSEACAWDGIYLQNANKKTDGVAAFIEAYRAEKRASELAPKEKPYYINQALFRSTKVAEAERDLGGKDDEAIKWYQQSLTIAQQINSRQRITEIYTAMRIILVKEKKDDRALALIQPRIQSLITAPQDVQRDKDLAQAYRDEAEIHESQKQWTDDAADRSHVVEILKNLKPGSYADQSTDLVYAYSYLSWAEIFGGQTDKGIADTQNAIALSNNIEGHPYLNGAYENGINALDRNNQSDNAEKLLNEFAQTLQAMPPSVDRERELATVVDADRVRIADARNQLQLAAKYREDQASRLAALSPDAYSDLKADLISAYGNLSFEEERAGNFTEGIAAAKAALKLDPAQSWIEENEASGLLLSGHANDARALYMKLKDVQWQGAPLSKAIGDDFLNFCTLGYARPEMTGIAHDLNLTTPELYSCLASPPKAAQSKTAKAK
jgi:hypothetical protein